MKTHVDGDDYTYPAIRFVPAEPLRQFDVTPDAQTRMDELEKRIWKLEKIIHLMLNPEEA